MQSIKELKNIPIAISVLHEQEYNNLYNNTVTISDGRLRFSNTKTTEPLTFKYLEKSLSEIIKNESQVKAIIEHVKQNREVKVIQEIKRVSNN